MRLSRIKVTNHSRLDDFEIQVREHLVLIGPNDVGKSSLLRCLDLALSASTAQLYTRITSEDFEDPSEQLLIEVELTAFLNTEKALFPDEISVDAASGALSLVVQVVATTDANGTLEIRRAATSGGTGRQLSREQVAGLGWRMVGAVASTRDLRSDRRGLVEELLRDVSGGLGAEKAAFDAVLASFQATLAGSSALGDLRRRLADQLTRALPQAVAQGDLTFVPGGSADNDALTDVRLQLVRDGVPRDLAEQSDGARALVAVALYDLLSDGANVVAVDEPEMHLHPSSQRSLARLLISGGNQKVLATHSADIVAAFEPDCVAVVKTGGHVTQPAAGFLTGDARTLARWWVRNRLEPLTARQIIAVEGAADRILVDAVAAATGRLLDRSGISVVEAGGVGDVVPLNDIFGAQGFDVGLSILIDEDARAETARKLSIPETDLPIHGIFCSTPKDLEGEYVAALGAGAMWNIVTASNLFSTNELSNCAATGPGGVRSDADVSAFCRRHSSYKIRAALAVAAVLTDAQARSITSIESVLMHAEASA